MNANYLLISSRRAAISLLFYSALAASVWAQTPSFRWAAHTSGYDNDFPTAASVDQHGNVIITGGIFSSSALLQGQILTNGVPPIPLGDGGYEDTAAFFVAKFDPAGNLLWARQAGPQDGGYGLGCATDSRGNVLVTGTIQNTAAFTLASTTLTNAGFENIFVAKYDPNGILLWARQAGGSDHDLGNNIAVDASDNIFVGGNLGSTNALFGVIGLTNSHPNLDHPDAFLAKYDPSGNVHWVRQIKRESVYANAHIATDRSGNCFFTANFLNLADFGSLTLTNLNGPPNDATFTTKYDSSGNVLWAEATGTGSYSLSQGIAASSDGGVCVAGNLGAPPVSMIKYDGSGHTLWTRSIPGTADAITADAAGNFYVTGSFGQGAADFGGITLTNSVAYSAGFIAKYDRSGNLIWAKAISGGGSASDISGQAIVSDQWGNVFTAGQFSFPSATFDTISLTSSGISDIFLAKLDGPHLAISLLAHQTVVSWPTNATGLALESSPDCVSHVWTAVTNTPTVVGDQNTLTLTPSGNTLFLRLHSE